MAVTSPAHAAGPLASTYDQATCASLTPIAGVDADDWDRAAIGEDAPALPMLSDDCRPARVADCNDPQASMWVVEMIGTCDMPRAHASLEVAQHWKTRDAERAQRLFAELSSQNESATPLSVPSPERELSPVNIATLAPLVLPSQTGVIVFSLPTPLGSIDHAPEPPPPRA